jgi:ABC-type transport system involved in multi-copper enzyme maturation permease subunit
MTTVSTSLPAPSASHYRPSGVLRSEWTKLRSVRSTTRTLAATVIITIGIGIIAASTEAGRWAHFAAQDRTTFDPTNLSLTGLQFGQLAIGVLGVLAISAEFGTGTIRSSLAAVPNRRTFLAAKAAVFTLVALVVGEIVSFGSFFIGQAVIGGNVPHATIGQAGVLRAVVGGGLFLAVLGLIGLGLGAIIRHTAGAIAAFVGFVLILPAIVPALPLSWRHLINKFEPSTIGQAMTTVKFNGPSGAVSSLGPWGGFAVLVAYAAVALGIGAWLMMRRDA